MRDMEGPSARVRATLRWGRGLRFAGVEGLRVFQDEPFNPHLQAKPSP